MAVMELINAILVSSPHSRNKVVNAKVAIT